MDELYRNTSLPLLVFEGIFDAIPFNGIALLGSKLSESKLELLKNAKRRLIFVVDRDKTGTLLGEAAINAGFEVSFIPSGFRDANEALVKTGAPWVVYNIMKSIPPSTTEALLRLKLNLLSPNGTK
jgi:DNA primase